MAAFQQMAAFAAVTAVTSIVPGPNMMFVMTQAVWRGAGSGLAALAGLEAGNLVWFVMAGLGLDALVHSAPLAFAALTLAGAAYLAWLGVGALRRAAGDAAPPPPDAARPAAHAVTSGLAVALGNPKSLVYMTALLPPFIDARAAVAPQIALLAAVALIIDVAVSLAYIVAGSRLNAAIARPEVRRRLDLSVGALFLLIALVVAWRALPGLHALATGA